ncbi:GNAT family N-acetyltransferase [Amycolatopsis suaedae]|uniref:GNAT family N-acetyltransferase n=1 Tax=Amycolatopsis suaedae TaxID=2510978 RepID=A0A4Q7J7W0_9PSEU|nr:GNAT family N-acetyltransferase [Amycolatopsis suaedae]RZQ62976.1 GNAT family N-acetyltransferase [Amycolatopsis suaedae]
MEIRAAEPADATALEPLFTQWGHPLEPGDVTVQVRRWRDTPRAKLRVAVIDGEIAGMAAIAAVPRLGEVGYSAKLTGLVVGDRHRRRGVGRALLDDVTALAANWGCDRIELTSSRIRDAAHAFYVALGYRETSAEQARYVRAL